ncbi:MAG TPA: GNAT family N-acetyltransferase [Streptosporangiaceae bacterium]
MSRTWGLRPLERTRDMAEVTALWHAALGAVWPPSPGDLDLLRDGWVAVDPDGRLIGLVAIDSAGSVPLILVAPERRRQGVGSALIASAVEQLTMDGVREIHAGSGGADYIWPGVPENLPDAAAFFTAREWSSHHTTIDLVQDLRDYRTPPGVAERAAGAGARVRVAGAAARDEVLALEAEHFPNWLKRFRKSFEFGTQEVLIARDADHRLVGSLLFSGPKADAPYAALLGPEAGEIGCVGVIPDARDRGVGTAMVAMASRILRQRGTRRCHIGWTRREEFYSRLGYRRWRGYHMFRRTITTEG